MKKTDDKLIELNDKLYKKKMSKLLREKYSPSELDSKCSWYMNNKKYFTPEAIAAGFKTSMPYGIHIRLSEPDYVYLKLMARKVNIRPAQYLRRTLNLDRLIQLETLLEMDGMPPIDQVLDEYPVSAINSKESSKPLKYKSRSEYVKASKRKEIEKNAKKT